MCELERGPFRVSFKFLEEIKAVYLATPVYLHAEQTIAAAEAGKHVLCEKPMALSVTDCDRMIAACQANGVQLSIAYYRHHYPVIRRVKELLAAGAIGQPVIAQINAFERFDPALEHLDTVLAPRRERRRNVLVVQRDPRGQRRRAVGHGNLLQD